MAIINNTWSIEHLQLKGKNKSDWDTDGNYVLSRGEVGLELDTRKCKVGDGETKWSALEYYSDATLQAVINAVADRVGTVEGKVTTLESDMTQAKSDISSQGSRLTSVEGDMTQAKSDISTLQSDVNAIKNITTISVNPLLAGE